MYFFALYFLPRCCFFFALVTATLSPENGAMTKILLAAIVVWKIPTFVCDYKCLFFNQIQLGLDRDLDRTSPKDRRAMHLCGGRSFHFLHRGIHCPLSVLRNTPITTSLSSQWTMTLSHSRLFQPPESQGAPRICALTAHKLPRIDADVRHLYAATTR